MASVVIPAVYLFVVFGGLFVFSFFYRKRNAAKRFEPYFEPHTDRDIYVTLLQRTDPPTPEAVLKAALVRRAMADVHRALRIREDKPALQNLLQKGSIGDDLWNSLLAAERELESEVREVVAEANTFVEGWGSIIFPTANEIIANEKTRAVFEQISKIRAEKELVHKITPSKDLSRVPLPTITVGPSHLSPPSLPTPAAPTSATLSSPASSPVPFKVTNGANSPLTASSEGDGPTRSPASSRTPNKSGKKGKKRK